MRSTKKLVIALVALASIVAVPVVPALALNYGAGTYGACQFDTCSITLVSSGTVNVNVAPTGSGACTIQKDTVGVFTDDPSGFSLTLANTSTNTAMLNGATSIPATSGTFVSPLALTANTWGYRVDGSGSFGTGPTTAQSNIAIGSTKFAATPTSSGSPDTIVTTAVPADPTVNTAVWYGVCANTSLKSGSYTSQVTYTAITN